MDLLAPEHGTQLKLALDQTVIVPAVGHSVGAVHVPLEKL